jgi:hypothetical protein
MDYFAGLDVSVKETSVCIVDDAGKTVREARVASEPEARSLFDGGHMGTPVESVAETRADNSLIEAAAQIQAAADAKKCWACGCLRHALDAIDRAISEPSRPGALAQAMACAKARLVPQRHECLGCEVCYPAVALDALGAVGGCAVDTAVCPTEPVEARAGWPPLPGSYRVLRYRAPVAVCTLNSQELVGVADPLIRLPGVDRQDLDVGITGRHPSVIGDAVRKVVPLLAQSIAQAPGCADLPPANQVDEMRHQSSSSSSLLKLPRARRSADGSARRSSLGAAGRGSTPRSPVGSPTR